MAAASTSRRVWVVLSILLPAAVVGVQTWLRRWISDDGFINVRVVQQIVAGNGPTYNLSERVEVGTSTLWLAFVSLGKLAAPWAEVGEVMVWLGTGFITLTMLLLGLGGLHLVPARASVVLPLGTAALAGLTPFWDFGTSGLETSLTFCWIAACFWALARRWVNRPRAPLSATRPWPVPVLIGLGVLIRPDLALVSLVFGVMLLCQSEAPGSVGGWGPQVGAGPAGLLRDLPDGLLRLAGAQHRAGKGERLPGAGCTYLLDYLMTYHLYLPVDIALVVLWRGRRAGDPAAGRRVGRVVDRPAGSRD